MRTWMLAVLVSCSSACAPPAADWAPIDISFPDLTDAGLLPYAPGGQFAVDLSMDVVGLCTATRAQVELVAASLPMGASLPTQVALPALELELDDAGTSCVAHRARIKLNWPSAGQARVRATAAGGITEEDITIEAPVVRLRVGTPRREGLRLAFPVCVASNAVSGSVELTMEGATSTAGAATRTLLLAEEPCAAVLLPEGTFRTFAEEKVFTTAEQFVVKALLVAADAKDEVVRSTVAGVGTLTLDMSGPPGALLPVGPSVVEIRVEARLDGGLAADLPIQFETIPATAVLPASAVTDAMGGVTVHVAVPKDVTGLRVDAVSGGVRTGLTLSR